MKNKSVGRHVKKTLLAIINPMSDLKFIYRHALRPVVEKLRHLRKKKSAGDEAYTGAPLSFSQAVAQSGKSVDELMRHYRSSRSFWWVLMVLAGGLAIILMLLLLAGSHGLPLSTFLRATGIELIFLSGAAVGAVKTAEATWHLWQLSARRVSVADGGTFGEFWSANHGYRSVIVPFWKGTQK